MLKIRKLRATRFTAPLCEDPGILLLAQAVLILVLLVLVCLTIILVPLDQISYLGESQTC